MTPELKLVLENSRLKSRIRGLENQNSSLMQEILRLRTEKTELEDRCRAEGQLRMLAKAMAMPQATLIPIIKTILCQRREEWINSLGRPD